MNQEFPPSDSCRQGGVNTPEGGAQPVPDAESLSPDDIRRALHDLRVHQLELEQQNEELRRTQAELDASRVRYFDLYDVAPVGYVTLNGQGLTLEANLTAATLLGVARTELVGQPLSRFVFEDDQDIYYRHRNQFLDTLRPGAPQAGMAQTHDLRMVKADGTRFWAHITATAAREAAGASVCRMTLSDITDMMQAEAALREAALREAALREAALREADLRIAALRESELKYRSLIESSSDAIFAVDEQGRYQFVNQVFASTLGRSPEYFVGKTFWDVYPKAHADYRFEATKRVVQTGQSESLEVEVPLPTGSLFFHATANPIRDDTGKVAMVLTHATDITERKRMLTALQASEGRYALTLAALDDGLWDWHVPSGNAFFSPVYYTMLGYEDRAFPATYAAWRQLVHPDDAERVEQELRQGFESGGKFEIDLRMKMQSGVWRWVSTRGKTVETDADGRAVRMVGTLADITERQRADEERARLEAQLQQAQKMESVGRLAGGVAHDFNNMLGVILGHAELALEQVDPAQPLHADLTGIQKAATRSAHLTRQLLAFARKQVVALQVLDLNATVDGMLAMLRRLIGEDIDLDWRPAADLWLVKVDPSQVDQILTNLLVNARDAVTGVGKVTVETHNATFDEAYCDRHAGLRPGEYVRLAVSDDGCGMDTETQAHVFEPFFTTKAQGKGTGLGLAMVYGIVKQNGGFIDVHSERGHGTTLSIALPRHVGKADGARLDESAKAIVRGHEVILLVEDEPAILHLTTTMLERQGYAVLAAHTPREAIRVAAEFAGQIHLLMTDVIMPDMNGRDLARTLLSLYPHLRRLFMSGYSADVVAHHGVLDAGVSFLQKPFSVKELAGKVRETLDRD